MMKEFLVDSVFFGAVLSLAAYEAEIGRASCRERVLSHV